MTSLLGERGAIMARTPRAPNLVYHERFERPLSAWESYGTVPQQWARAPSPDDRRGVLVSLTPAGRARVDEALADLLDVERDLLADLPVPDREQLADLLRRLVSPFDDLT